VLTLLTDVYLATSHDKIKLEGYLESPGGVL
jgi:hypothetical protein